MVWVYWLIAAVLAAIVELFSTDFIFLMLAGGALGGMTAALLGTELWVQVLAFSVVSLLLLFLARPAAQRWMARHTPQTLTNVERLRGRHARTLSEVTELGGRVKLDGEVWSARSAQPEWVFAAGEDVQVVEIDGAFALVAPLEP